MNQPEARSYRAWRAISIVLGALLLLTNAGWLYLTIDTAVTASYQEQVRLDLQAAREQTLAALNASLHGRRRAEVEVLCKRLFPHELSFEKDNVLWFGSIGFSFASDGTLMAVVDDLGSWLPPTRK